MNMNRLGAGPRLIRRTVLLSAVLAASGLTASAQAEPLGKAGYQLNCSACHMASGEGIPGAFPALADSSFVAGDARDVLRVIVYGRAGMPAFGDELSQDTLTAIVAYIREEFNATSTHLTAEDIASVTKTSAARMARED
ncbi:c-type cytochrome [Billgrantia kenyensis]|uniref:Cytochrome c n=1 Tax=Billgrantia kenyensis TaxID=321266 RepID=A0A7W0AF91_9GAMM|nr:cytochrome c [Halomonas kenyensis]MBA2780384.1 cytochrome c [Halomonas kenyensis]MCG6663408.1 cytochrome c [Halomonas kenyensis]